jgi:hypothetical protein
MIAENKIEITSEFLSENRNEGDEALDHILTSIMLNYGKQELGVIMKWAQNTKDFDPEKIPSVLLPVFNKYSQFPPFVEKEKMESGFRFFKKYVAPIAMLLGCYSLPYCYMGADGAQVLYLSEKIHQNTTKRLNDTGDFVREMHNPKKWESGENFIRAFKVRVLHGVIRTYLGHTSSWNPSWGVPLNQEDKAGTNLAFSYIVMSGLKKLGFEYNQEEAETYLHTWKVIGFLMGVRDELLVDTMQEAEKLDRLIVQRNFRESDIGRYLTKALIDSSRSVIKLPLLKNIPTAIMREMLGEDYSKMLNIPDLPFHRKLIKFIPFNLMVRNSKVIRE